MLAQYLGNYAYWELRHRVTFDGVNRLIVVNPGESQIDIRRDIYSAWVEWAGLHDYSKYAPAVRYTGAEPTTAGQFSGVIFFVMNGWRVYFDHTVKFTGTLFSDDYDSPFLVPANTYMGQSVVSSLVTEAAGFTGAATPEQNAEAVRLELGPELAQLAALPTVTAVAVQEELTASFTALDLELSTVLEIVNTILKYSANRTLINQTAKTLTVFEDDGVTPLRVFNLRNFSGAPSITEIAERRPW